MDKKVTIADIIKTSGDVGEYYEWIDNLAETISDIFEGREPSLVETIFRGFDHRYYRPALHTIRQRSVDGELISAHITFQEKITGPNLNAPRELEALAAALRLGYRFRWEILEEFVNIVDKSDVKRVRRALQRLERRELPTKSPSAGDFHTR